MHVTWKDVTFSAHSHCTLSPSCVPFVTANEWQLLGQVLASQCNCPCLLRGLCTSALCYQILFPKAGDIIREGR